MITLREAAQQALEALELIDKEFKKHGRQHWPEAVKARNAAPALRAALAEPYEYARANPLGGPAVMFDAIAERLRAGEPYGEVLADYGLQHTALAEPVQEPDAYCVTTADGGCVSTDPRCMHNQIHTCSYYCINPACIKAQRDELRDKLENMKGNSNEDVQGHGV